jgi:AcrR family transcriptional regulator
MVARIPDVGTAERDPADGTVGRASPMSRDDRRAAIIRASLPLLREHGHAVTTRQIAEASGIGEGTIFRVFTDKAELIDACLGAAFDQAPTLAQLAAIDPELPLEPRLVEAVTVLQRRLRSVVELLVALRFAGPPEPEPKQRMDARARFSQGQVLEAIAALLEPDAAALRTTPLETAKLVRLMTFAASHPKITDGQPLEPEEIVRVVLHGVLAAGLEH